MSNKRQHAAITGVIAAAVIAAVYFAAVDPVQSHLAPRCVFRSLTGFDCPGCGLQRALHALLHGDVAGAWTFNPFLFFIAPVGATYLFVELSRSPMPRLRKVMFSSVALWTLVAVTVAWWIARNVAF